MSKIKQMKNGAKGGMFGRTSNYYGPMATTILAQRFTNLMDRRISNMQGNTVKRRMVAYLIMDGQWGSTGKGLIAGFLANERHPDGVVCNFGPNAGHTYVTPDGETVMTQQLPTGIVTPGAAKIFIGPGAIIDPDLMTTELEKFAHHMANKVLIIHPRASIVLPQHKEMEKEVLGFISSTQKGTGASVASKIMRCTDVVVAAYKDRLPWGEFIATEDDYTRQLLDCSILQIESAQGFELGLNQGFAYPHCTSRDVTPGQILNDCGLPIWINPEIIVTLRTFPIRVGHQFQDGVRVGHSGPVYDDQVELAWGEGPLANMTPERTTVTQKIRRIFSFSFKGFNRMTEFVKPDHIFLNFANYLGSPSEVNDLISRIEANIPEGLLPLVKWVGYGPSHNDVVKR